MAPEEPLVGETDTLRLRRVLDNFIANAVKYSPEDAPVTLMVLKEERGGAPWVSIAVRDMGIGVPAADLPHIFEHYRRGTNVGERFTGADIGLSGVKQIVEQHGGLVEAESEVGLGSVFTLRLPLTPSRRVSPPTVRDG